MASNRQELVGNFTRNLELECYSIAPIVLEDGYLDDYWVGVSIAYVDKNREKHKAWHDVTNSDIDEVRALLVSLLDIPYSGDMS